MEKLSQYVDSEFSVKGVLSFPSLLLLVFILSNGSAFSFNDNKDSVLQMYYESAWEAIDVQQHQRALAPINKGIELLKSADSIDYEWRIDFNNVLGVVYEALGHYRQMLSVFEENLRLSEHIEDEDFFNWTLSAAYSQIAVGLSRLHLFEGALDYYQRAKYIDHLAFPENYLFHFINNRNLGIVHMELNRLEAAFGYFQRAEAFLIKYGEPAPAYYSNLQADFGRIYMLLGETEKAKLALRKSKSLMDEHGSHIETYLNWYQLYMNLSLMLGDTLGAISTLDEAIAHIDYTEYQTQMIPCRIYNLGGQLHLDLGNPGKAAELFGRCLEKQQFELGLPPEEVGDIDEAIRAQTNLLRAELALTLWEKEEDQISGLSEIVQKVESSIELLRHFIGGILIPHSKNRLVRDHIGLFETGVHALYELYQITEYPGYLERAILISDQSRSVLLLEELVLRMTEEDETSVVFEQDMELKSEYDQLFLEVLSLQDSADVETEILELRNRMADIQSERETIFLEVFSQQPRYVSEMIESGKPEAETLDKIVRSGYTVLTHFPGNQFFFTLAVSKRGAVFQRSELPEDVGEKMLELRNEIEYFPNVVGKSVAFEEHAKRLEAASRSTFDFLFRDVGEIATEKLLIIPVDEISAVPFSALSYPGDNRGMGPYLIEKHEISYTYSLKSLEMMNKFYDPDSRTSLGVFSPRYKNEAIKTFGIGKELLLSPLEFNQRESEFLGKFYSADVFEGEEATLWNFMQYAPEAGWLHLSGHAFVDDHLPEYSFFAFTASTDTTEGQLLSVNDISRMNLNNRVVFLNGCQTGFGPVQKGEGALSLQRAFASAGVGTLVTTLWPVNDETAYMITREFYENLPGLHSIPASLRKAGLKLIETGDPIYSHPYNWAGYVSYGNWENPMATRLGIGWIERLVFLAVFLILSLWILKRFR